MKVFIRLFLILFFITHTPLMAMGGEEGSDPKTAPIQRKILLSCDGGGMREIGTIAFLKRVFEELNKRLQTPVDPWEVFDLFGGTSAGGLTCLMLASGKTLDETSNLFWKHASEIFPQDWYTWAKRTGGYFRTRYPSEGLTNALKEAFGDALLTDVRRPVFVTTYCHKRDEFYLLDSQNPDEFPGLTKVAAGRATPAAPTYFSSPSLMRCDGEVHVEDGGVGANDPGSLTLAKAKASLLAQSLHHPDHHCYRKCATGENSNPFILISLGTGKSLPSQIGPDEGLVEYGLVAVPDIMSATRAASQAALKLELDDSHYLRFQFLSNAPLDTTNLEELKEIEAAGVALANTPEFTKLIDLLVEIMKERARS